jgi:hypothetical protein
MLKRRNVTNLNVEVNVILGCFYFDLFLGRKNVILGAFQYQFSFQLGFEIIVH